MHRKPNQPEQTSTHHAGRLPLGLAFALFVTHAPAVNAGNFAPPGLEGFSMHAEREADGDGDGVNETRIQQYLNQNGDSVVSMSSKGQVWGWSLNSRNDESALRNFVIRDSDCDGVFDEVYSLDDEFHVPDCVK